MVLAAAAGWSEPNMVPDIGILAATDPVALDAACLDLVTCAPSLLHLTEPDACLGKDKFTTLRPATRGNRQLEYGQEIGLGSMRYTLVEV